MPKYLFHGSYTSAGAKGLLKDGGTGRRAAAQQLAQSVGGKIESFYYAFGSDDFYLIVDMPDHESAAAVSLTVAASGAISLSTVVLMTPEQVDSAAKKTVQYRPPGA